MLKDIGKRSAGLARRVARRLAAMMLRVKRCMLRRAEQAPSGRDSEIQMEYSDADDVKRSLNA
jgi:hypothetical protein